MNSFKRILVGLDLTEMDKTLIQYTSMLTAVLDVDAIYFMHIAPSLELPDDIVQKYPDLLAPLDESLEKGIRNRVDQYFENDRSVDYQILVKEGNAADQILRWSGIKEIDLILMGRKRTLKGSGILPGKLAKIAHCSLFMVPEFSVPKISKIMVPVDFSKKSAMALAVGMDIRGVFGAELVIQNTYRVPVGYHASGKTYEEFANIMKGHAEENAKAFLSKNGVSPAQVQLTFSLDDENEPADKIYQKAQALKADLVVIASRGRTGIASVLLGSVADKMCQNDTDIPLLIIKDKNENMGVLEALLRL